MDKCIESILACDKGHGDIEILIVNDGSTDDTPKKADEWHERYPETIYAIHKPNGGHGSAVNAGLAKVTPDQPSSTKNLGFEK